MADEQIGGMLNLIATNGNQTVQQLGRMIEALSGVPLIGVVPINRGGTGQTTAVAAFNALSPTTTRGDLIYRNASTNTRLAASTAGYLLQTNGAGTDPSWNGFVPSGTGAVTRTWQAKAREIVSVKDFGAVGNNSTDDTAAIQAAIDSVTNGGLGGIVYFPPGEYIVAGTLTIVAPISLVGSGRSTTVLRSNINTNDMIVINQSGVTIESMRIDGPAGRAAPGMGSAIVVGTASGAEQVEIILRDLNVLFHFVGVNFVRASSFNVFNCLIQAVYHSMFVANQENADSGDSSITNCQLSADPNNGFCIYQSSSGGLKLTGNKFLNAAYHYFYEATFYTSNTADFLAVNNSLEGAKFATFQFTASAGVPHAAIANIMIVGNQIANVTGQAVNFANPGFDYISNVIISGNDIDIGTDSGIVLERVQHGLVCTNIIKGASAVGKSAIIIGGASSNITVIGNEPYSWATPVIVNSGTNCHVVELAQSGTASINISGAYGTALFSGTTTITFPTPYSVAPVVMAAPADAGAQGGVSVSASSVSTTGATLRAVGVTNTVTLSVRWVAQSAN